MAANLSKPVETFIAATHARDSKALMATFSGDAVLADMGKTIAAKKSAPGTTAFLSARTCRSVCWT